jgi:hypothetical protein
MLQEGCSPFLSCENYSITILVAPSPRLQWRLSQPKYLPFSSLQYWSGEVLESSDLSGPRKAHSRYQELQSTNNTAWPLG